jgi:bile acid:Na+ symporter, BASS family
MISLLTDIVLPALVFALMVIVGMELRRDDFAAVAKKPRSLGIASAAQVIVAPAVALVVVAAVQPDPALAAALILLSICPSGALSNLYVLIARGNVALSICLTTVSSVLCIAVTPILALLVFEAVYGAGAALAVPTATVLLQLGLFVLAPVLLGMIVGQKFRAAVEANRPTVMAGALAFLVMALAIAVAGSWRDLADTFWAIAQLALLFTAGAVIAGRLVALLVHPDDRSACAIECAVRNIPVALLLAGNMASDAATVAFAAGYFVIHAPLLVGFSLVARRNRVGTPGR